MPSDRSRIRVPECGEALKNPGRIMPLPLKNTLKKARISVTLACAHAPKNPQATAFGSVRKYYIGPQGGMRKPPPSDAVLPADSKTGLAFLRVPKNKNAAI